MLIRNPLAALPLFVAKAREKQIIDGNISIQRSWTWCEKIHWFSWAVSPMTFISSFLGLSIWWNLGELSDLGLLKQAELDIDSITRKNNLRCLYSNYQMIGWIFETAEIMNINSSAMRKHYLSNVGGNSIHISCQIIAEEKKGFSNETAIKSLLSPE